MRIIACSLVWLILLTGCSDRWSDSKISESKKRGDNINVALQKYKDEHSEYPADMNLLIPKYIKKLDSPTAGNKEWVYAVYDSNRRYNLGFKGKSDKEPECWYDSGTKTWSCDTK